ncbi:hypothetical protein CEXT_791 [Caerostris extrusa]|uniref:SHSP domain-containing protein n=1 Tax=Caerostris extrusa TaxID=172846 RepID=A0AAV4W9D7_CAEEX|nr:hypothetical protein CEXT_791 [Caerostris extrusa]
MAAGEKPLRLPRLNGEPQNTASYIRIKARVDDVEISFLLLIHENQILYLINQTGEYDRMDREHIFHDLYFRQHFPETNSRQALEMQLPPLSSSRQLTSKILHSTRKTLPSKGEKRHPWLEN